MSSLSDLGEDSVIAKLTTHLQQRDNVIVGPGDDCAVVKNHDHFTLLKTDTIAEGVHYLADADPFWVGWKAVARVVSDIAAMGGTPDAFVVALAMRETTEIDYLTKLYAGMNSCAEKYQFSIVGGETTTSSANIITISATGACSDYITRSGAGIGDHLYVTGNLGGSIAGKHLTFTPRLTEAHWLKKYVQPSSMMDLSDGIAKDLPRLAKQSNTGYSVDFQTIPCNPNISIDSALKDGEDYELLFTTKKIISTSTMELWKQTFPELALTRIGQITPDISTPLSGGYEHYSSTTQPTEEQQR